MAHVREQIREAIVTELTGLTTTGTNVYKSRVYPRDTLPCVTVYTLQEEVSELADTMDLCQWRDLIVAVSIHARAVTDADDVIDTIAAEVEAALHDDTTLGGLTKWLEYRSLDVAFSDGAEQPTFNATMQFLARYSVNATDPETVIA